MANLKCEYPDDCRLNLEAKVIITRYLERQVKILDINFVVPGSQVGGKITSIKNIMVNVLETKGVINSVEIFIEYQIIMTVAVGREFQVVTIEDIYEQVIDLQDFDPPLSPQELRTEVQGTEIILSNWNFISDIIGNSEDESNPCNLTSPIVGTCINLQVYVDITVLLDRVNDIIVFGELDPETTF